MSEFLGRGDAAAVAVAAECFRCAAAASRHSPRLTQPVETRVDARAG